MSPGRPPAARIERAIRLAQLSISPAVATAGTALVAVGSADTVSFRDAEDVTHTLTGAEAVQFGLAVMQWVSAHYAAAWAHKDAIKALQAAGEDFSEYDLSQGWPEGAP